MNQLKDAIDKAVADQYPSQKPSAFQMIYGTAEKKSQRARWSDHFALQLKSHGFTIMAPGMLYHGEGAMVVFPEFKFHPARQWRIDYAIPKLKIAIEIDGGIWMPKGAHSRPQNIQRDIEKQNAAVLFGWHPLRFSPVEIKSGISIQNVIEFHANLLSSKTT